MSKKQKRWRVSDIVGAAEGAETGARVAAWLVYDKVIGNSDDLALRRSLRVLWRAMSRVCGVSEFDWQRMTHEQRCDALVATAKRLNVPMNG